MRRPTAYMMVGISGSGKSTYAYELSDSLGGIPVLSSDDIRAEIYGNAECQDNPGRVFAILYDRARSYLLDGISVIIDGTNIVRRDRKSAFKQLSDTGCLFHAIFIDVPLDVALYGNASRDRFVPEYVIERQFNRLSPPTYDEGFDNIEIISR